MTAEDFPSLPASVQTDQDEEFARLIDYNLNSQNGCATAVSIQITVYFLMRPHRHPRHLQEEGRQEIQEGAGPTTIWVKQLSLIRIPNCHLA